MSELTGEPSVLTFMFLMIILVLRIGAPEGFVLIAIGLGLTLIHFDRHPDNDKGRLLIDQGAVSSVNRCKTGKPLVVKRIYIE